MQASQIIDLFEDLVDDGTELSPQQELDLLNRVYKRVLNNRPWTFLLRNYTTTLSTTVPYISLPTDFGYIPPRYSYDNPYSQPIRVGVNRTPFILSNFSDRNRRDIGDNVAYIDQVAKTLVFRNQPLSPDTVSFDYVSAPQSIGASGTPILPTQFHEMLAYMMASDDYFMQQFDKNKSYAAENKAIADGYFADLCLFDSQFINING